MPNDDQLEGQLRRMAERSMASQASAVNTDAALAEHRRRVDTPQSSGSGGRRWLFAAVAVLIVAAGVTAVAWPRNGGDVDLVATETVTTPLPSTGATASVPIKQPTETQVTAATNQASASPTTLPVAATNSPLRCNSPSELDSIVALLQSGPVPVDYNWSPDLDALVTSGDRTVIGTIKSVVGEQGPTFGWTAMTVTGVETLAGPPIDEAVNRISLLSSGVLSADQSDPIAGPVGIDGLRFVAVLARFEQAPGGWTTMLQGLSVACADSDPAIAIREPFPSQSGTSLDEIADAVRELNRIVPTPPEPVQRPVFDPEICATNSALEGDSVEQPVTLFAKPSAFPIPLQVFTDPDLGEAGPIVMAMRFRDRPDDQVFGPDVVAITDSSIRVQVLDSGTGEATWTADDGTVGYLRSNGVDMEALVKIVSRATPRDLNDPIPGFDFFSNREQQITASINGRLELTAEALTTTLPGAFRTSECTVQSTGFVYYTTVLDGGPVLRAGAVLDRPAPLQVGQSNGSVIIINGNQSNEAPRIEDLRNATGPGWDDLLNS